MVAAAAARVSESLALRHWQVRRGPGPGPGAGRLRVSLRLGVRVGPDSGSDSARRADSRARAESPSTVAPRRPARPGGSPGSSCSTKAVPTTRAACDEVVQRSRVCLADRLPDICAICRRGGGIAGSRKAAVAQKLAGDPGPVVRTGCGLGRGSRGRSASDIVPRIPASSLL